MTWEPDEDDFELLMAQLAEEEHFEALLAEAPLAFARDVADASVPRDPASTATDDVDPMLELLSEAYFAPPLPGIASSLDEDASLDFDALADEFA